MSWKSRIPAAAIALLGTWGLAGTALAQQKNCYEGFAGGGCPWKHYLNEVNLEKLSCENLRFMRNQTYKENGYCFRTADAKEQFGNSGCKWPIQPLVPLNKFERHNIVLNRKVSRTKRCKA